MGVVNDFLRNEKKYSFMGFFCITVVSRSQLVANQKNNIKTATKIQS